MSQRFSRLFQLSQRARGPHHEPEVLRARERLAEARPADTVPLPRQSGDKTRRLVLILNVANAVGAPDHGSPTLH